MRFAIILIVPLLAVLALACGGGGGEKPAPTQTAALTAAPSPTAAPATETLVYLDPEEYLALIRADGSGQTRLTTATQASLASWSPWSPDGRRLAFYTCEIALPPDFGPCNDRIYIVNVDGSGLTRLVDHGVGPGLDWSPDGTRIAFSAGGVSVMDADGLRRTALTDIAAYGIRWSPDGSRIAFASVDPASGANSEIYAVNADGSNLARLTEHADRDDNPVWSPDGTRIAFTSFREGRVGIYVMNPDGSAVRQITNEGVPSSFAWSPDGSRLCFLSATGITIPTGDSGIQHELADIYVVNGDGSDLANLGSSAVNYSSIAWSPDGTRIAFTGPEPDGSQAIYVVHVDGSQPTRLTEGSQPAWQPQP